MLVGGGVAVKVAVGVVDGVGLAVFVGVAVMVWVGSGINGVGVEEAVEDANSASVISGVSFIARAAAAGIPPG